MSRWNRGGGEWGWTERGPVAKTMTQFRENIGWIAGGFAVAYMLFVAAAGVIIR